MIKNKIDLLNEKTRVLQLIRQLEDISDELGIKDLYQDKIYLALRVKLITLSNIEFDK
jgi:hypothetical protein